MPPTPTNPTTSARNRLAALLAHHADVAAAALRADARTGLPEYRSGMDRAVELLDLHAAHLTADEETPAVRELLDSILSFEAEHPAAPEVARRVLGTTTPPASGERPDHALYTTLRKYGHTPAEAQQMIDTYTQTILNGQGVPAVDRATVLNEAANGLVTEGLPGCYWAADYLRRLAAEAQQPTAAETEARP
ncbi:hypothetical protein ACGFZC_01320 [[Kitasatospora] papulosa]|uniref:hypothetical protein n=1 Tax=[Kitasatospora] papulosa TaxID=1464011 RepID=UPI0037139428